MSRRIQILTPAPAGSTKGNRITAERWAALLDTEQVTVVETYEDAPCDLLIALHARRNADAIARARAEHPTRPLILALTGTDLYRDIQHDAAAQRSLELADLFIGLHPKVARALPESVRHKARWAIQSAVPPPAPPERPRDVLQVCVLGHLRAVKDPLRAPLAARALPADSRIQIVHCGAALDPELGERAQAESESNPRYTWLGDLPHAEALNRLASSHLHVLTSTMEGGANAVCEALACGVPTISSRIDGSIGLLGEDYPGYFPPGETAALTALLTRFESDGAFRETLAERTATLRDTVDPAAERASLLAILEELLPTVS